jgi:phosphate-selective porin OprO/OprP
MTLKVGVVALVDYTAFHQDDTSLSQVGKQKDQWEARAARLMVRGTLGKDYKIGYLIAGEYNGFETEPENLWSLTDLSFTFPLGGPAAKLTVGKTKETFAYEMVGDAANLPHQERVLNPFFVSRNIGVRLNHVIGTAQRMTAAVGIFNDWWSTGDSLEDSGTDVTARFTGLVRDERNGKSFLHLGVSGRYAGADNNSLRYKGRPESNVSDPYVDTGNLSADHAWHLGWEALWNEGPYSLLAEYNRAWVSSTANGDPEFSGYYLTGSWILTGETRPYDRTVGYARRVMPEGRWGAWELVARFSHVDLDDAAVQGGSFDKTYLGLNWWATRRWKFGVGWGHTWLDRFSTTGETDSVLTRFQWVYCSPATESGTPACSGFMEPWAFDSVGILGVKSRDPMASFAGAFAEQFAVVRGESAGMRDAMLERDLQQRSRLGVRPAQHAVNRIQA